jgi:hypothetical protein
MKITPENTIRIASVNVRVIEVVLECLKTHGSVYVEVGEEYNKNNIPSLAEVLFRP